MSGRPLKNFDTYRDKLEAYSKACELTLEYRDHDGDGTYFPSRRKIVIDKDLPESTEIATFLHEIGHSMDDTLHSKSMEKKFDKAYKAIYSKRKKPTPQQKELVLGCEERAWMYGRAIAKKLRIPLGKWYDEEQTDALKSYRDLETK